MQGYEHRTWPKRGPIVFEDSYKEGAGIPWLFRKTYIDTTQPKNWEQAQIMDDLYDLARANPRARYQSLVVSGGCGTGKSHLGCGFVNTLLEYVGRKDDEYDFQPMYVNEADLLIRLTGYGKYGKDWFGVYSDEARYLVIDEFGMSQWTTTESRRVEQLLNKRFSNGYKTVILTNLTSDELWGKISSQLKSRLLTGRSRVLTGHDMRQDEAEYDDPF